MAWFAQIIIPKYHLLLAFAFSFLGFLLEILQMTTGYRAFEWADVLANSVGALLGWAAMHTFLGRIVYLLDDRMARRVEQIG